MTYRVAGIGEILWDRFPDGDRLGGAPANFAFHAAQLGAHSRIISRTGADLDGEKMGQLLDARGLSLEYLQRDPVYPTGSVQVELKDGQPSYRIARPVAWDQIELTAELKTLAMNLDAICFGTLAQRDPISRQTIQSFVQLCPPEVLRLFDINLRQNFFIAEVIEFGLAHANILKLNGEELTCLAELFHWPKSTEAIVAELFKQYPIQLIALTHGAEGCEIHSRQQVVRAKPPSIIFVDAVGAGDAFSAALLTGVLAQRSLEQIADRANRIGAFVASQSGAMPLLPLEYRNL